MSYHFSAEIESSGSTASSLIPIRFPWAVFLFVLADWLSYLYGLSAQGLSVDDMSGYSPISPANENLWLFIVTPWPYCKDVRSEMWKLSSLQLVHSGFIHIGGNSIAALGYGFLIECYHDYGTLCCAIVYSVSVIMGSLGHLYFLPFLTLIGSSGGVYGLIGCCIAVAIMNRDSMDKGVHSIMSCAVLIQILADFFTFYWFYDERIGYFAHLSALMSGIFLGLAFFLWKAQLWKKMVAVLGIILLSVQFIFLFQNYWYQWPPQSLVRSRSSCCEEYLQIAALDSSSSQRQYICVENQLIPIQ